MKLNVTEGDVVFLSKGAFIVFFPSPSDFSYLLGSSVSDFISSTPHLTAGGSRQRRNDVALT